jgi:hypothetical protein
MVGAVAVSEVTQDRIATVQARLEILFHKLEQDGSYVSANTVHLAQRLIEDLARDIVPAGR